MVRLALRSIRYLYSAFSTGRQLISFWICPASAVFSILAYVNSGLIYFIIILLTGDCLSKIRLPSFTLISLIVPRPILKGGVMWHSRRRKAYRMLARLHVTLCFSGITGQVLFCENVCTGWVSFHHMHIILFWNFAILHYIGRQQEAHLVTQG